MLGTAHRPMAALGLRKRRPPAGLNGIYTIWRRDVIRFLRDRSRILGSLGQPLLFLIVFGSGLSSGLARFGGGSSLAGLSYVQFMFPGIIVMAVLFTSISSAISIVWDREFGFLREVLVAPVPRWAIAVGKALGGGTTAMFQGIIVLIFAPFLGVHLTFRSVLELLPLMFLTAFALCSFGLLIAARMTTMEGFQVIMNFLLMPMFFLSGALFPLTNLPGWLALLTHIDPVSYGVDAVRRVILGEGGVPPNVVNELGLSLFGHSTSLLLDAAVVSGFALIMMAGAVAAFSREG